MIGSEYLSVRTQLNPPMRNVFIIYTILQMKKRKAQGSEMTCPMTYYEVLGKCSGFPMGILGGLPIQLPYLNNTGSFDLHFLSEPPDDNPRSYCLTLFFNFSFGM